MRIRIEQSCAGLDFHYGRGEELEVGVDIPNRRAMELLNGGIASPIRSIAVETADEPVHIGAGWYRVKGRKIRGKEAAFAALEGS